MENDSKIITANFAANAANAANGDSGDNKQCGEHEQSEANVHMINDMMALLGRCGSCRFFRGEDSKCIGLPADIILMPETGIIAPGQPKQRFVTMYRPVAPADQACALHRYPDQTEAMIQLAFKYTFNPDSITTQDLMLIDKLRGMGK